MSKKDTNGVVTQNRRARFNYTILEKLEAGIILTGSEVKSLRFLNANLTDSYAVEKKGSIILLNSYIPEYPGANRFNHAPRRERTLLLKKKEVSRLIGLVKKDRVTLVPLSLYFNKRGIAKVELAVATGKKQHDKRETIKQRDWDKQKSRILKNKNYE